MVAAQKKCPFCAETILAEAIKCRYCGSDLTESASGSAPNPASGSAQVLCDYCNRPTVAVTERKMVSAGTLIGSLLLLVGVGFALVNLVVGALIVLIGVLFGTVGAATKTVLVCTHCGKRVAST